MGRNLESKLIVISNLFSYKEDSIIISGNGKFIIPEFQRAYQWSYLKDNDQCEILLDDISNYIVSKDSKANAITPYFLGSIIISKNESSGQESYSKDAFVIDGQQRLTTIMLLLKAISLVMQENLITGVNDEEIKPSITKIKNKIKAGDAPKIWHYPSPKFE